jgi:hypoxanthine-DNA glycosylase
LVTLHEEIRAILLARACEMTTREIADEVNRRGNYQKRGGSQVDAYQVHGRTKNYVKIFTRAGATVNLVEWSAPVKHPQEHRAEKRPPSRRSTATQNMGQHGGAYERVQALPYVAAAKARVLVLGTIPGANSIRLQQYYAHPRNQFWRILFEAFGCNIPQGYDERVAFLFEQRIALWDVLKSCAREGSLDTRIKRGSERPNDIAGFLRQHPETSTIALNGGSAYRLFQTLVAPQLADSGRAIDVLRMPSTSPAHTISLDQKLEQWRTVFAVVIA